ncbi:MAG: diguanylate cyclase [Candidatus Eremiobacteraeota bacterium]|nr:diguanylate cyclase [Candidatus Eremiobacteraeota bacterium]
MTVTNLRALSSAIAEFLEEFNAMAGSQDAGAALQFAVTRLPELFGANRAFVYQITKDRKRLVVTHESAGAEPSLLGLSQPIAQLPAVTGQAVRTGKQVFIDDLVHFPITDRQRRSLRFSNVVSTVMTPFGVERRFAGILAVDVFDRTYVWDKASLDACARIAGRIGRSIGLSSRGSHLSSNESPTIETKSAQLNVLANLSHSFANVREVQPVIDAVIDELGMLYGTDAITIYTSPDNSNPEIREAFSTGELLVRSTNGTTRYVVPLGVDDEVIGAIDLKAPSQLSADDARFLQTVARLSGSALAQAERMERILSESTTDRLTGLFNYRYFMEHYGDIFAQAKSSKRALSALLIDADGLRQVDSKLGYGIGDNVLTYIARQIKRMLPQGGIASRFGNDEFMVLLPDTTLELAARTAKALVERISEESPPDLPPTTVSIGVATAPTHTSQPDVLLELVEKAVYVAKYGGRNRVHVVSKSVNADWERLAMEALFAVITSKQFSSGPQAVEKAAERLAQAGTRNLDMALALAQAVDVRDKYTSGHSHAVSNYSLKLARGLFYGDAQLEEVRLGALLHDVGKIGTPEHILGKNGPLTDEEFAIMRNHPEDGARILAPIPSMRRVSTIVEAHQESWDGTGYPHKLAGEEIPRAARIVSIADAYHAMVSTRSYRKGMSVDKACGILTGGAGKQWDPRLIETFVKLIAG